VQARFFYIEPQLCNLLAMPGLRLLREQHHYRMHAIKHWRMVRASNRHRRRRLRLQEHWRNGRKSRQHNKAQQQ
jgi:hypothetical protein